MELIDLARQALSIADAGQGDDTDRRQQYFDNLAQDAVLKFGVPEGTPLSRDFSGKEAVVDYWRTLQPKLFEDVCQAAPPEFVCEADRIVVSGREDYTIKGVGMPMDNKAYVIVLDFRDGLIVKDHRIKEMSEFVDICRSGLLVNS